MPRFFSHPNHTNKHGLLHVGGQLTPDWLFDAYTHGIFPWPLSGRFWQTRTILSWFSPDPRCIFEFDQFHVSRRLEQTCKSGRFHITTDTDFSGVIRGCAERHEGTWITPEMIDAYIEFHRLGYAHSVEAWSNNELAGGVYGIAIGGMFAAESMFYNQRDASNVALVTLMRRLKEWGYQLVDIQVKTEHTARFGAVEISRSEYLRRLHSALRYNVEFDSIGVYGSSNSSGSNNPDVDKKSRI